MGCDGYREALSARLDGEDATVGRAELDLHVAGCAACRQWLDDAATVNRLARTGLALPGIDVTEAVLAAAPGRWRGRLAVGLRVGLGTLGAAQLALGLLQVTALRAADDGALHGAAVDGATAGHLWHESAAWNVAVGGAFLWVAARRARPVGIVPILTIFVAVLVMLSGVDVVAGHVTGVRLASHAFVLVGYLIVLALSRPALDLNPPGRRQSTGTTAPPATLADDDGGTVVAFPQLGRRSRDLPAARLRYDRREAA